MKSPHRRLRSMLLILVLLVFVCLLSKWGLSNRNLIPTIDCPSDKPAYPNYQYFYKNAESKQTDCSIINELRSSSTEAACPELFIVGTRKGGTTSLYRYISQHPGFRGQGLGKNQNVGETHYFSFTFHDRSWRYYLGKFGDRNSQVIGESSVSYLPSCMAPYRMRALCGVKPTIVVLLREPVERLVSTYVMRYVRQSNRERSLQEFVSDSFRRDKVKWEHVLKSNGLDALQLLNESIFCLFKPARNQIYEGLYSIHLKRWLEYFPRENFLIWKSENFRKNPSYHLSQLIAKLGLQPLEEDELSNITSVFYNKNEYNIELASSEDRTYLHRLYRPFNQQLKTVLEKEFDWD